MKLCWILMIIPLFGFANGQFEKENLIGIWELDYKTLRSCEGELSDYDPVKGSRCKLVFKEKAEFERLTWDLLSYGRFRIQDSILVLDASYDENSKSGFSTYKFSVESVSTHKLVLSFIECDQKIIQTYTKERQEFFGFGLIDVNCYDYTNKWKFPLEVFDVNDTGEISIADFYDVFDDAQLSPLYAGHNWMTFRVLDESPYYYKVLINENEFYYGYLKKREGIKRRSWKSYWDEAMLLSSLNNQIHESPSKNSKVIDEIKDCRQISMLEIKGQWMHVEPDTWWCEAMGDENPREFQSGWIKWRDEKNLFIFATDSE
ncbi:MAG: hypothetical protein MRY83_20455 [Flavobacteriales bacterium]|nr:hypothetical protein [Flavobacteriales bacterium]